MLHYKKILDIYIRREHDKETLEKIGKRYNVTHGAISNVVRIFKEHYERKRTKVFTNYIKAINEYEKILRRKHKTTENKEQIVDKITYIEEQILKDVEYEQLERSFTQLIDSMNDFIDIQVGKRVDKILKHNLPFYEEKEKQLKIENEMLKKDISQLQQENRKLMEKAKDSNWITSLKKIYE